VTGAPSRLESDSADTVRNAGVSEPVDDGDSWVLAGLGCEMLRVVARYADELVVRLDGGPSGVRRIAAEAFGAPAPPDLTSVEAAAKAVGLSLSVGRTVDSFLVWLSVEDRQPQSG
jgi:alkanesulfonate monooxygenase SsuD/methylene tetrahydromethanopterin reductase-like flavin-dependent oxidoreductase (luciferase family)